jgi:DNA polymerase V
MKPSPASISPLALPLRLCSSTVAAGFPSPADDYLAKPLDLNQHLVAHPAATYLVRAKGHSMMGVGIHCGDLLVVDYSLEAKQGDVVIAAIDGELTCKILDVRLRSLVSANPDFPPILLPDDMAVVIEGVVTASIRYHRPR